MTYDEAIKQTPVVLVEFFASWCPHCRKMMPVVDQVKELLDGSAAVIQLDIDENKELAQQEEVEGIPTFIIYSNGEEQWRHSGEIDGNSHISKPPCPFLPFSHDFSAEWVYPTPTPIPTGNSIQ